MTRLRDYRAIPGIRRHVIVEPAAALTVLSRDQAGEAFRATGLADDDTLRLPEIGVGTPDAELYAGLDPPDRQP